MRINQLSPEAKISIEEYLRSRLISALAFFGVLNVAALFGIYTTVSDKVAEQAAKDTTQQAIEASESQLKALTDQLDELSTMTTIGFAEALMPLGEARERVKTINKEALGLEELKLDHVNDVIDLLNNSIENIASMIESAKAIKEIEKTKVEVQEQLDSLNSRLDGNLDSLNKFREQFSIIQGSDSVDYIIGPLSITCGTIQFSENSHVSEISFEKEFLSAPTIIVTPESDSALDYGYPMVSSISKSGFRCSLADKLTDNDTVFTKNNGRISYIAIGRK